MATIFAMIPDRIIVPAANPCLRPQMGSNHRAPSIFVLSG